MVSAHDQTAGEQLPNHDRLNGWKEIAAHLGNSVRAAQRRGRELGLPVHHIHTLRGQIVFASMQELDRSQLMKGRAFGRGFPVGQDQVNLARLALLAEKKFDRVLRSGVANAARAELLCQACPTWHSNGQSAVDSRRARALLECLARSADSVIASRARSVFRRLHRTGER